MKRTQDLHARAACGAPGAALCPKISPKSFLKSQPQRAHDGYAFDNNGNPLSSVASAGTTTYALDYEKRPNQRHHTRQKWQFQPASEAMRLQLGEVMRLCYSVGF